jgi:hypothetical protein
MATKKRKKTPAKKATAKKVRRGRGGPNKSAFIRDQPATMTAKEVVAAAAQAGIVLTEGFVYNVRSNAKTKSGRRAAAQPGRKSGAGKAVARSEEQTFRQLVVGLGITRAKALVAEVEQKLAAVIAGR